MKLGALKNLSELARATIRHRACSARGERRRRYRAAEQSGICGAGLITRGRQFGVANCGGNAAFQRDVKAVVEQLATVGYRELNESGEFVIPGFAKMSVVNKPATEARSGVNPFTKEPMEFAAKPASESVKASPLKNEIRTHLSLEKDKRIGRLPPRDSLATGPRLLRQTDRARMDSRDHRAGVGEIDATSRLHTICGARRGLGDGNPEGLTRDDILDNVTLDWLTNTAVSSARLYWDTTQISRGGGFFDVRGVKLPVAVSAFPDEIYAAPKSWSERAYPNLIHYNKLSKGGHFAAWEQPAFFVSEMRAAFKSLRQSN
jgi:nucleoid DNA-binding protein